MSMKVNYNVSAMLANNSLKQNDLKLTDSLARLSSGFKINSAKDNAAGLAIARRMNAQLKGLREANQEAKDGVAIAEIADGALSECHDILQRINELCVKAATGSVTDDDRAVIQDEVVKLTDELTRIGKTTEYNGQPLLDGTFDNKGYVENNNLVKVRYYSDAMPTGDYTMSLTETTTDHYEVAVTNKGTGEVHTLEGELQDGQVIAKGPDGYEIRFELRSGWEATPDLDVKLTGYGAMTLQVGANEHQTIDMRIPELSLLNLGLGDTDGKLTLVVGPTGTPDPSIDYAEEARKGIDKVKNAINFLSSMRSSIGAYQNRLEHTENNLSVSEENVTGAYSRIMDTDMAEEMTNYSNLSVVSQAATSILAQANERPSQLLQLLQ